MSSPRHWWAFSRPHTIIGSFFSISALYVIASFEAGYCLQQSPATILQQEWSHWLHTLVAALACNVFIVGLNQWQDVAVDRINKPWLPLASGAISLPAAKAVVMGSLLVSLLVAAWEGWWLLGLIAFINAIGAAYSLPPFKLKRHHLPAAVAIVGVRGLLVNLGMTAHFMQQLTDSYRIPAAIGPLALFVVGFSFGIAWFKDIPDTSGDEQFAFKTLAVTMSRRTALWLGVAVVGASYLLLCAAPWVWQMRVHKAFFTSIHALAGWCFVWQASRLSLQNEAAIKRFYMFFWLLFFLEYIFYPLAYWLAT